MQPVSVALSNVSDESRSDRLESFFPEIVDGVLFKALSESSHLSFQQMTAASQQKKESSSLGHSDSPPIAGLPYDGIGYRCDASTPRDLCAHRPEVSPITFSRHIKLISTCLVCVWLCVCF